MGTTTTRSRAASTAPRGVTAAYLDFCAEHLPQLGEHIAAHDLASVSRIARTLKGNAGFVGLGGLSRLGEQLVRHCAGPDWTAIDAAYQAIAETVHELRQASGLKVPVVTGEPAPARAVGIKLSPRSSAPGR